MALERAVFHGGADCRVLRNRNAEVSRWESLASRAIPLSGDDKLSTIWMAYVRLSRRRICLRVSSPRRPGQRRLRHPGRILYGDPAGLFFLPA